VQFVRQAANMGDEGLQPVWWNNPPFYKYVLLGEYAGLFGIGRLLGWYTSVADFGTQLRLDPTWLYLLGRATSALFGTLTVLVAYWLGKIAYNRRVGLLAAWFLAVCFIHVRDSHYAVNDVALTFFVTIALLAAVKIVKSGEGKWYVLAGAVMGAGFATKYSAILAMSPVVLAHFLSPEVQLKRPACLRVRRLAIALATAGVVTIVVSPYFVVTPRKVIHDVYEALYLPGRYGFEGWQIDPAGGYIFYLKSLAWGLGWGLLFLALAGLGVAILRHFPQDLVLLSLPVTVYALMGQQHMYFARFVLPMVPALLVLGASLLDKIPTSVVNSRWGVITGLVIGALVVTAQPLTSSLRSDYLITQTDTRTLAKQWIEANVAEGARIAVDQRMYGPPLSTPDLSRPDSHRSYEILIVGGKGLSDHTIEWYQRQDFDWLIASSFIYNIPLVDEDQDTERQAFYASLDKELELVQEFCPCDCDTEPPFIFDEIYGPAISLWQRDRPGPTLKIYRVER
jgi:hypothetical protein